MIKKLFLVAMLGVLTLYSCKNKESVEQELYTEIPEDFIPFYEQFHNDTLFQVEHIQFPLEGIPSLSEDTNLEGFTFWWERDGWKYHKPFNSQDNTFTRSFSNFAGIITETIKDGSGQFTMMRRFTKIGDEWKLIYYKEMGR